MKKFTLLIAMLFCFIGFSQKGQVDAKSIIAPTKVIETPSKKQVTNQQTLPYAGYNEIPADVLAGVKARVASAKAKKVVRFSEDMFARVSSQTRVVELSPALKKVLAKKETLGDKPGRMSDYYTQEEIELLRSYYAPSYIARNQQGDYLAPQFSGKMANLLTEDFDDITTLPGSGFTFVNASDAPNLDWFQGNDIVFPSHAGASTAYIGVNFNSTAGSIINNWMILPALSLENGDEISFWTRTVAASTFPDRIEVRISPDGSTTAPSGPADVGSYTELLLEINPTLTIGGYPETWTQFTAVVSGLSGETSTSVAFRYWVTDAGPVGANSNYIGIDSLSVDEGTGGGGGTNTDTVYVHDVGFCTSGDLGTFEVGGPYNIAVITNNIAANFAGDMDDDNNLFVINTDNPSLDSVDKVTGLNTVVANITGLVGTQGISGLSWDTVSATWYVLATDGVTTTLYSLDPGTGALTVIGDTGQALGIWLAIDKNGNAYSADIGDDNLYSIDLTTGAGAIIGASGLNMNFAQDAGFDDDTDTLYAGAYTGGGTNQFCSVDTTTGAFTPLGTVNSDCAELGVVAIERTLGGGGGGCTTGTFTDRPSFEAAFGGTLAEENFAPAPLPGDVAVCTVPINSAGGDCYAAGEIEDGLEVDTSAGDRVVIDAGFFGANPILAGPAAFADNTIINFPDNNVNSFGFDLWWPLATGPSDFEITITGTAGVLDVLTVTVADAATPTFVGYISNDIITSVEIGDFGNVFGDLIGNVAFGNCDGGGGGNDCNQEHPLSANVGGGVGSSVNSDFKSASDITVAPGEQFTIDTIDAVFLTIAPNDPPTTANIVYYTDNGGFPGSVIGSETVVPTIVSSAPWANPVADQYITTMSVTPFTFAGDPVNPTSYWIEISMGTATSQPTVFWEYNRDGVEGFPLAQFDGTAGTWSYPDLDGDGNPDLDAEVIYNYAGTCDPLVIVTYDDCEGALSISCGDTVMGDTLSATVDSVDDCTAGTTDAPGVWYKWEDTSGLAADVLLSTCSANTDYDTQISVFTGPDCNNLTCVAGNDDSPNCTNFQSEVEFESDGNSTYYILVYGFGSATGNFELSMTCTLIPPPNDDIVNAIDLDEVGCPFTDVAVAMPAATLEGGTPTDCDITGAAGVWYKFTPEGDGFITGTIATPGPGVGSTNLSVNNGPLAGDYNPVAALFGGPIPINPLTEDAVVVIDDDTTGDANDACDPILNGADLNGKIAVLRRGSCEFGFKALAAQNEGAVAVVVVNNQPGDPIEMGGGAVGDQVTIPVVMISDVEGEPIIAELLASNTVNMTLSATFADVSSVTFYTAPDETSSENELVLVDYFQNQCVPGVTATIPTVAGQAYYCFVVNTGAISDIIFDNCDSLGVDSNEIEGFAFYPNPASDKLNLTSLDTIEKVALYNILGQQVIALDVNATTTQVDISNLSVGAYIMKVTSNGQTGTYKVVKK